MNEPSSDDDPLTLELARLLDAARDKADDSPDILAVDAFMLLLIERARLGYAS